MNNFTKRILLVWAGIGLAALAIVFLTIASAHADNGPSSGSGGPGPDSHAGMTGKPVRGRMMAPGVFGKVTAVNGATITVTSGRPTSTPIIYTIVAANAVVIKNATTSSVGNIAVGDLIVAQGTVSGTSVAATRIIDGAGMMGRGKFMDFPGDMRGSATGTRGEGNGSSSDESFEHMRPSGTPPFGSGTFAGDDHGFGTSTPSGTPEQHHGRSGSGFFGSVGNFFGNLFGHFKF